MDVTKEETRICSTKTALTDMLETASRRLERVNRTGLASDTKGALEETIAQLKARIATHRGTHGC
jgi:hypothetical protein